MSSITIVEELPSNDEFPKSVAEEMVGLTVTLCTPQSVFFVGHEAPPDGDIGDWHDGYPVESWTLIHALLIAGKEQAYEWWLAKYSERHIPRTDIILFASRYCQYNT